MKKSLITLAIAGALVVSSISVAGALTQTDDTIYACVNSAGVLKITDGTDCLGQSELISWNSQGIQGEQGIPGVDGIDGTDGVDGLPGPAGPVGPAGADGVDGVDGAVGPAGPAGADGVSGYVQITQNSKVYVGTGGTFIVTANCPAGLSPLGGGGFASGNAVLTDSVPTATGWSAKFRNDGALGWLSTAAYAVCADV